MGDGGAEDDRPFVRKLRARDNNCTFRGLRQLFSRFKTCVLAPAPAPAPRLRTAVTNMVPNRIWHDPVVEIYGYLSGPGPCCSAEAYDLANRRWYRLDVDADIRDEEWLCSTVVKHILAFYDTHGRAPPWNVIIIRTTGRGSPVAFEVRPEEQAGRPIRAWLSYGDGSDRLPTTTFDRLEGLRYISRAADRCTWNGADCVFKRIEFDCDVKTMRREIRVRETLMDAMSMDAAGPAGRDVAAGNAEMMRRFLVIPVVAVVIGHSRPWRPGTVAGILMPFAGQDLDMAARDNEDGLPITERQLAELVRGVRELARCGLRHGDITYWNTMVQPEPGAGQEPKLMLIDVGSEGPDYPGDSKSLADVLRWCLKRAPTLREQEAAKARVEGAAAALDDEDFDAALQALSVDGPSPFP